MTLRIWEELEQGTDEWLQARAGIVTASVMGQLITTKTLTVANNETARALTAHLAAERITNHVEDTFTGADMLRGQLDEPFAREVYAENYAPVDEIGFMVRDDWGFSIGFSPDGLVDEAGLIEVKSRRAKKHLATILADEVPTENTAQIQTGLLVSGREWCDYLSYCSGMPLYRKRVFPIPAWQNAIVEAAEQFEANVKQMIVNYHVATHSMPPTERINHFEEII